MIIQLKLKYFDGYQGVGRWWDKKTEFLPS